MNFTDYQNKARGTAKYPVIGHGVIYPTLGLANEAGEVAGKIKKIFRDKDGVIGSRSPQGGTWGCFMVYRTSRYRIGFVPG
jgi:hypothetical protein